MKEGSIKAFKHYANEIENAEYIPIQSAQKDCDETNLQHLLWMCNYCIENIDNMPVDKYSRWLGFIQGCLISKGLTTVTIERDRTRPWFNNESDNND